MARRKKRAASKLKIIPLGGLGEIGKNITCFEYEDDIIVVDCGLGFPEDDMLGIDLVIPDVTYLQNNIEKVRGIFLTHGHEDHIGALPYVLRSVNVPIYATKLTLGILQNKLVEHHLDKKTTMNVVAEGETVTLGCFSVEFIRVNHSIADAVAFGITSPVGTVVVSGDFKIDLTPVQGKMINLTRFGELGNAGVAAMLCESTNVERQGYTPSERTVGKSLGEIFDNCDKRVVIATFSSNIHRVQQIIDASVNHNRKVCITGRSMVNIITAAHKLGYMNIPEGTLVELSEMKRFKPNQLTLITTGSQGEPMSALYRMAYAEHEKVQLGQDDLVVISAHPIPGNEKTVSRIINELLHRNVTVLYDQLAEVHVSGHACQEEIKTLIALVQPKNYIPVHGEYKHLVRNRELAMEMGIPSTNIFVPEIGKTLELDADGNMTWGQNVPSGKVLVDGFGVGDVGNVVLRDRKHLSQDGLIVVVVAMDVASGLILSDPDIVSRGFVYVKESEELMEALKNTARSILDKCDENDTLNQNTIKTRLREDLTKFVYQKTKKKPMILPIIIDV